MTYTRAPLAPLVLHGRRSPSSTPETNSRSPKSGRIPLQLLYTEKKRMCVASNKKKVLEEAVTGVTGGDFLIQLRLGHPSFARSRPWTFPYAADAQPPLGGKALLCHPLTPPLSTTLPAVILVPRAFGACTYPRRIRALLLGLSGAPPNSLCPPAAIVP